MIKKSLTVTIDGKQCDMKDGSTVLEAAMSVGVAIPTLCYHQRLEPYGACRVCQVELKAANDDKWTLVPACTHPLRDGDSVRTDSEEIIRARRFILQLMLARAPQAKAVLKLAEKYNVEITPDSSEPLQAYLGDKTRKRLEEVGEEGLTRCILCGLCSRVCREVVGREAISSTGRGPDRKMRPPFNDISPTCIGCGACAYVCPNEAIKIERKSDEG